MITEDELRELVELKREGPTLDYKQDLRLGNEPENAEFVKDVLALANSGRTAYIVTGIKDGTWEPAGIAKSYSQVQLNQILQNRTDPPISVEYAEVELNGSIHGVVKISGEDPPYLVMVKDRYGGIQRGTLFVRNVDMNEGARRADLDRMYAEKQRAKLVLKYELVERKLVEDLLHVGVEFTLLNEGTAEAGAPFFVVLFKGVTQIVECTGALKNATKSYSGRPSITALWNDVMHTGTVRHCGRATIASIKSAENIEALAIIKATNMNDKQYRFTIPLQGEHVPSL